MIVICSCFIYTVIRTPPGDPRNASRRCAGPLQATEEAPNPAFGSPAAGGAATAIGRQIAATASNGANPWLAASGTNGISFSALRAPPVDPAPNSGTDAQTSSLTPHRRDTVRTDSLTAGPAPHFPEISPSAPKTHTTFLTSTRRHRGGRLPVSIPRTYTLQPAEDRQVPRQRTGHEANRGTRTGTRCFLITVKHC